LHEYQGKKLLAEAGVAVPAGGPVTSPDEAAEMARRLGGRVILKVQAWITGRAAMGGIRFADTPEAAGREAAALLGMKLGHFVVKEVLVERAIDIAHELFVSLALDDESRAPVLLLDAHGGSGIEERAGSVHRLAVDCANGIETDAILDALRGSPVDDGHHDKIAAAIRTIVEVAGRYEARSLEVNPLVVTTEGEVVAADCRMTIDDYAVFRHPELGIEIARELDHPATDLERWAYQVEQQDHRGTFFFAQLPADDATGSRGLIGFHGAGGGGSMMSMDAVSRVGFGLANFCDTSGNPSASKVYRAARIILAQPGLVGYFGSGSGVASQEQYHSAYGLAKAFVEVGLSIPAVIRLGGNGEDRAVEILQSIGEQLPATVLGYRKDDTPAMIADRFAELVEQSGEATWSPRPRTIPAFAGSGYSFEITHGTVWIDHDQCDAATTALVVKESNGLLRAENDLPVLAVAAEDVAGKDSELVALEIECRRAGRPVVFVDLPVPGLDE
jgi:succinyl-CoA synthetase beta subunit